MALSGLTNIFQLWSAIQNHMENLWTQEMSRGSPGKVGF